MWITQSDFHDRDISIEFTPEELKLLEKKAEYEMVTVETALRLIIREGLEGEN